jgi:hypothetical protein
VTVNAFFFVGIATILCAVAVLGWLGLGQLALSGSDALERDGLPRGGRAPTWNLLDSAGVRHSSPPADALQLVVFADHSLKSFPSVIAGLRGLRDAAAAELDILVLTRGPSDGATGTLRQLGLADLPVVAGSPALYGDYNVRVMPFAIFVDSAGLVRASSLLNHDWQVAKLHQVAQIPVEADDGLVTV